MLAELEHAPVGHQVRHDVLVVVVQLPLGLGREIVDGEVHQVRPAQVHPLETLGAGVAEGADEQPEAVAGDDGHVVGARRQTPLVEPLTADLMSMTNVSLNSGFRFFLQVFVLYFASPSSASGIIFAFTYGSLRPFLSAETKSLAAITKKMTNLSRHERLFCS